MSFIIPDAANYLGKTVDDGHCVRFMQIAGRLPLTSMWKPGAKVRGLALAKGTCIATFTSKGGYLGHAAVLEGEEDVGLAVIDCWVGQPVARRIIRFRDGSGPAINDGDQYYVIEVSPDTA